MSWTSKYLNKKQIQIPILLFIVFLLYGSVHRFDFLYGWDDQWFVTNKYTENGLGWENIYNILSNFYYGQYAPINQMYYTTIFTLFGYNTLVFHIAGVCIHAINVLLVFILTDFVIKKIPYKSNVPDKFIGFSTALLFAIMPINVEPVVWVSASKVLIYAMFYLLALICYCNYLNTNRSIYYYLTLLSFILSFGAKEQAVTLPLALLLFDKLYNRELSSSLVLYEKVPYFLISILFGLITLESQELGDTRNFYPIFQRIPLACFTIFEYFTKTIIPINLSYLYPFPFEQGESMPFWLLLYLFMIPSVAFCFIKMSNIKWMNFGLLFFLIHILMVTNLFSLARHSVVADRYAYVASLGICFILSNLIFMNYNNKLKKRIIFIGFALYAIVLFSYSFSYSGVWQNVYTLKKKLQKTIQIRPDYSILKTTDNDKKK